MSLILPFFISLFIFSYSLCLHFFPLSSNSCFFRLLELDSSTFSSFNQTIGVGPASMIMPGLNAPLGEKIAKLPEDSDYKERLVELQKQNFKPFKRSQHPLERGWTSARFGGRKIGPPDPIGTNVIQSCLCRGLTRLVRGAHSA